MTTSAWSRSGLRHSSSGSPSGGVIRHRSGVPFGPASAARADANTIDRASLRNSPIGFVSAGSILPIATREASPGSEVGRGVVLGVGAADAGTEEAALGAAPRLVDGVDEGGGTAVVHATITATRAIAAAPRPRRRFTTRTARCARR